MCAFRSGYFGYFVKCGEGLILSGDKVKNVNYAVFYNSDHLNLAV